MIRFCAGKIAYYICGKDCKNEDYELYNYAAYIVLSSLFHFATIAILGLILNVLLESIIFYGSFVLIRKFAGGYHAKSPARCYAFSVISGTTILVLLYFLKHISNLYIEVCLLMLGIGFCVVISIFAPVENANNPLNIPEKRIYKKISIMLSVLLIVVAGLMFFVGFANCGFSIIMGIFMSMTVVMIQVLKDL